MNENISDSCIGVILPVRLYVRSTFGFSCGYELTVTYKVVQI
jgi:hypothetical protein